MTNIKTPKQIAEAIMQEGVRDTPRAMRRALVAAIKADRAQRDLYELIAEALDDRGDWDQGDGENAQRAAALIRAGTEDYIWDRYIGPMVDDLMQHLGAPDEDEVADPCVAAGEHQFRADHRSQECPVYHEEECGA
ncbi:hypothetical protein MUN77_01720 [Leucobacter allii]|uniref:hypothetical protein n=1 Tax=Leucobacter allii TaxID=2932247 RepID=UPI001FD277D0|nr:hypothetical protein [Leucobacter allii]UOR02078.1 hypothetical protein MUN77_01720 [Leucobacter allii]